MATYRKSKYSALENQKLSVTTIDVLNESPVPLTISEICVRRPSLMGVSTQKMSRVLNELCDYGVVQKSQSKAKKRMVYIATSQLEAQGYNIENLEEP